MNALRVVIAGLLLISSYCVSFSAGAVDESLFVQFSTEKLKTGRTLWLENCKGCHAYGTAGAPVPMTPDEWKFRVIKNKAVLYDHAINGFFGPDDTMMPERGGNPELSDEQVKHAVDYMVALAKHYIEKQSN